MKKNKKIIIALIIAASVVVVSSVLVYALVLKKDADTNVDLSPATEEQKQAGESTKDTYAVDESKLPPTTVKSPEQAEIINAYQDNAIGKVVIQTKLPGSSWASCSLKLAAPDGTVIEKTAKAFYQPEYSTCQGFSIDRTEFRQAGTWTILLTAKKVGGEQSQVSGNVTIE